MKKYEHGGDVYSSEIDYDFSANLNPFGMPEEVKNAIISAVSDCGKYPDPYCRELVSALSEYEKIPPENIICGNGASDLIYRIVSAVKPKNALLPAPTFSEYEKALVENNCNVRKFYLHEENNFSFDERIISEITPDIDMIFLCSPNNPVGNVIPPELLKSISKKCFENKIILAVDECFLDFVKDGEMYSAKTLLNGNVVIIKAFTKSHALAGIRLGYALFGSAELAGKVRENGQAWSVSVPAQAAGIAAVKLTDYAKNAVPTIEKEREFLSEKLTSFGIKVFPSQANFLLFKCEKQLDILLLKKRIAIRSCENYDGLTAGFYRIAVRTREENSALIAALEEVLRLYRTGIAHDLRGQIFRQIVQIGCRNTDVFQDKAVQYDGKYASKACAKAFTGPCAVLPKMGKPIMIQGTMSNVGKSLITAALCRIFTQDGYSCAPFKSQNMALNSYVTLDGLEMGRAQAMQAEAAGIEPSVSMNPILMKPTSDVGSQVIVNGEVVGNMRAMEYFRRKREFVPTIREAYKSLAETHDIVVIEGAGSPAELNLKAEDIVNMGMAKIAKAPVLLVGNIDLGGVFAQLIGTLSLLEQDERDMVKGFIVNKFRGDKSIFQSGVDILEQRGGKLVTGVIPYIDCNIEDEDSLSEKLKSSTAGAVDIAVIRLPRISNFTDFDVFLQFPDVSVRYVTSAEMLGSPDMIIIPGTKSTISDMKWLRENGLEAAIKNAAKNGVLIFGICGGYQLLGKEISDPFDSEGGGSISGMGLLNTKTVFSDGKRRTRTNGIFAKIDGAFSFLSGADFEGYEIHLGRTESGENPLIFSENETACGAVSDNVCGCYVHGIFDSTEVSGRIVKELFRRKGLTYSGKAVSRKEYKQTQYDLLADTVRENADMKLIYRIIEEGI